eukprot:10438484-Lingulodinium_polyedra.AAC.1
MPKSKAKQEPPAAECEPAKKESSPNAAPENAGPPEMFTIHRQPNGERWVRCWRGKSGDKQRYATEGRRRWAEE